MRIKDHILLCCLVVSTLGLAPIASSDTRDCVLDSLDQEFKAAAAVFEARVTAVEWIPGRECCHAFSGWATVQTERWWKGKPTKELRLEAVGQIFKVGERYVVFAFGKPLIADGCNNTKPVSESAKVLEWLAKKVSRRAG